MIKQEDSWKNDLLDKIFLEVEFTNYSLLKKSTDQAGWLLNGTASGMLWDDALMLWMCEQLKNTYQCAEVDHCLLYTNSALRIW